jgi:FMN phosphatase YigB (HAD superfamily)
MQMISHVLFDLDDTLCDFSGARDRGLAEAFSILAPEHREEAVRRWHEVRPLQSAQYLSRRLPQASFHNDALNTG